MTVVDKTIRLSIAYSTQLLTGLRSQAPTAVRRLQQTDMEPVIHTSSYLTHRRRSQKKFQGYSGLRLKVFKNVSIPLRSDSCDKLVEAAGEATLSLQRDVQALEWEGQGRSRSVLLALQQFSDLSDLGVFPS